MQLISEGVYHKNIQTIILREGISLNDNFGSITLLELAFLA